MTIIQKPRSRQGPRGHAKFSAIVQALFGLAELLESRIWPQRSTEPTNLSSGIRKSPQRAWFMGSQRSLHISLCPQTACATLSVVFPLVWMCYLLTSSYIHLSLHPTVDFFSHTQERPLRCTGKLGCRWCRRFAEDQIKENCASICTIINTNTHTKTSLMPAHVRFSSVTESNQLCHPSHKSPSTAVAPSPDGNRPRPVALVSVS